MHPRAGKTRPPQARLTIPLSVMAYLAIAREASVLRIEARSAPWHNRAVLQNRNCPEIGIDGMESGELTAEAPSSQFQMTRWSLVLKAGDWRSSPSAHQALSELAQLYWFPLYAFLRKNGHRQAEAEDLVQDFLMQLLQNNGLNSVDPAKGRFRSFLLSSLKNRLRNEWDKSQTLKRGGGQSILSLDTSGAEARYLAEPAHDLTAEKLFERRWALDLLDRVLQRLKDEYGLAGQTRIFQLLQPALMKTDSMSYAQIGTELSMSEGAVKVAVHRLRRRYRAILRDEVGQTVADVSLIDEEIQELIKSL